MGSLAEIRVPPCRVRHARPRCHRWLSWLGDTPPRHSSDLYLQAPAGRFPSWGEAMGLPAPHPFPKPGSCLAFCGLAQDSPRARSGGAGRVSTAELAALGLEVCGDARCRDALSPTKQPRAPACSTSRAQRQEACRGDGDTGRAGGARSVPAVRCGPHLRLAVTCLLPTTRSCSPPIKTRKHPQVLRVPQPHATSRGRCGI